MSTLVSTNLKHNASVNNNIVLDGSGNASFQTGTAAAPSINANGDTNTGIYFPAADTIGFTRGGVQVGEFDSSANFKFNSGFGSVSTAYACRAWVNFNGTGTVAIKASGNVSSITDNGTGAYTINFASSMPDANYSYFGMTLSEPNANPTGCVVYLQADGSGNAVEKTTTKFRIVVGSTDSIVLTDLSDISVSFVR